MDVAEILLIYITYQDNKLYICHEITSIKENFFTYIYKSIYTCKCIYI